MPGGKVDLQAHSSILMTKGGETLIRFFIRRLLTFIPIVIAVTLIVFVLVDMTPGDRMSGMDLEGLTTDEVEALRASLGIDDPLLVRFGRYLFGLVQGDLGTSDLSGFDVFDTFMSRLPNSLALGGLSIAIAVAISIPMGVFAARRAGKIADNAATAISMIGMATPNFWVGMLLILVFSGYLKWLPAGGFNHGILSLLMPATATCANLLATSTRQTRSSMLEVLNADYLRTARAKGVPEKIVIRKHALRNALIPIVTVCGISVAGTVSGTAVTETVFSFPGTGRLMVQAVSGRDLSTIVGVTTLLTITFVMVVLLVDIAYTFVDPRIKTEFTARGKTARKSTKQASIKRQIIPLPTQTESNSADIIDAKQEPVQIVSNGSAPVAAPAVKQDTDVSRAADANSESRELLTKKYKRQRPIVVIFRHLLRNPGAIAGIVMLSIMIVLFIISLFVNFDTVVTGVARNRLMPPTFSDLNHLFGTDQMGRSLFMRTIYATRFSLPIGFFTTLFAALIGFSSGSIVAYYGKIYDSIAMRIADTISSIPGLLLSMVVVTVLGRSMTNLIIAIGIGGIPGFMRMSRASVLTVKGNEFVEAGRAMGLSSVRIIFAHVLPNGMAPLIISATNFMGMSILAATGLSFLGLGIPIPNPEWGSLISDGRNYLTHAPWLTIFPGIFIVITVLGFCMLGDGLRDALDPKQKNIRVKSKKAKATV